MALFDPRKYVVKPAKPLPVLLLLDVSGSMGGQKIAALNKAVKDMIQAFVDEAQSEVEIQLSIITFGNSVEFLMPLTRVQDVHFNDLHAGGGTPMGTAVAMAKDLICDKTQFPSGSYRPTVVILTDGKPTESEDFVSSQIDEFINENNRSSKTDRMAIAIGSSCSLTHLEHFIKGSGNPIMHADDAAGIAKLFKFVTMSVQVKSKPVEQNRNVQNTNVNNNRANDNVAPKPIFGQKIESSTNTTSNSSSDDEEFPW